MLWRKKQHEMSNDATTNSLINSGVYTINMPESEKERKLPKNKEHNLISGVWYVFILSCLLWWLPPFGQMIAGYLGGRKAGSPIKGIFVTIIPALFILLLVVGMDVGLFPFLGALGDIPNAIYFGIHSFSPHAASFLAGIYNSLIPVFGFQGSGFLVIVTFGLIGGIMAEVNKKEIMHATHRHFYDAFLDRFSGASLNKIADMVAERVIWTLGTIEQNSMKLLGRSSYEPSLIGFEEMQKLPSASMTSRQRMLPKEMISYEPNEGFEFESLTPVGMGVPREEEVRQVEPRIPAPRYRNRRQGRRPPEEKNWGESHYHYDMGEESVTDQWKEPKRNIHSGKNGQRLRPEAKKRPGKLFNDSMYEKEKRDALVYDGKGELINEDKPKKTPQKRPLKRKQPALIERALAADKEIKEKTNKETEKKKQAEIPLEPKVEERPKRVRQENPYDRL